MLNQTQATVYIVDDHWCSRDALYALLTAHHFSVKAFDSGIKLLDEFQHYQQKCTHLCFSSGECAECRIKQPGCLVLDVQMPVMSGLELQQELIKNSITMPIIFVSGFADVATSVQAFKAGAFDFFEKPYDNARLVERIQQALTADSIATEKRCTQCKMQIYYRNLTERERDVFALIVKGYSNKEIGKLLNISHRTIETHRAHLMEKMKADSLADLITIAVSYSLLE